MTTDLRARAREIAESCFTEGPLGGHTNLVCIESALLQFVAEALAKPSEAMAAVRLGEIE